LNSIPEKAGESTGFFYFCLTWFTPGPSNFLLLMRLLTLLSVWFFASITIYGQIQAVSIGYIVTFQGDTVFGEIANAVNLNISEDVMIKPAGESEIQRFDKRNISCVFDPETGLLLNRLIAVDYSPIDFPSLRTVPEPDLRVEKGFIRALRNGRIRLYSYERGLGRLLFFVSKENDSIIPLIDYTYYSDGYDNGKADQPVITGSEKQKPGNEQKDEWLKGPSSIHLAKYKGQLIFLMSDWPGSQAYINRLKYKQSDILQAVDRYNSFFAAGDYTIPEKPRPERYFGISAAIGAGHLYYYKSDLSEEYYNSGLDFPVRLGIYYEIVPRKFHRIIKFQNLLSLDWYKATGTKNYVQSPLVITDENSFSPVSIVLTNNVKFCLPRQGFSYYAAVGVTNSYILHAKNEIVRTSTLGQTTSTKTIDFVNDLIPYHLFYTLGLGVEFSDYAVELRFDPAKELTRDTGKDIYHRALLFQASYRF